MTPEQLFKKAQAHLSANKKAYIIGGLILLAWINKDKIKGAFGFNKTRDENYETVYNARYRDQEGNRVVVPISDGTRALIYRIKVAYVDGTSWLWQWGAERCEIANVLVGMSDEKLAELARGYHQATGKMLYTALYGVATDPCRNSFTNLLWEVETDYDRVLKRLQTLNIY